MQMANDRRQMASGSGGQPMIVDVGSAREKGGRVDAKFARLLRVDVRLM